MADRLPGLHAVRQAALLTLALPSTVERLGAARAASHGREVWQAARVRGGGTPKSQSLKPIHGSPVLSGYPRKPTNEVVAVWVRR